MSDPSPGNDSSATENLVQCEITGQQLPEDQTIILHGYRVGPEGKRILLDRLEAGEALPGELERPTALRRFACMFLDGLLIGVAMFIVTMAIFIPFGMSQAMYVEEPGQQQEASFLAVQGVSEFLSTALGVLYFTLLHGWRGQTVGKMAGRLKVVQADGSPISNQQAFWRAMIYTGINALPALLSFVIIVNVTVGTGLYAAANIAVGIFVIANIITALVDRNQQRALHDRIVGTRVIVMS